MGGPIIRGLVRGRFVCRGRPSAPPGSSPGCIFPARLRALLTRLLPSLLLRRSSVQSAPRPLARGALDRAEQAVAPVAPPRPDVPALVQPPLHGRRGHPHPAPPPPPPAPGARD